MTTLPPRKRRNQQDINLLLTQYRQSGQSQKKFAKANAINYKTFQNWISKNAKREGVTSNNFIPLHVDSIPSPIYVEVYLRNGHRLVFHQAITSDLFQHLIK
jgi:hypothetical protein